MTLFPPTQGYKRTCSTTNMRKCVFWYWRKGMMLLRKMLRCWCRSRKGMIKAIFEFVLQRVGRHSPPSNMLAPYLASTSSKVTLFTFIVWLKLSEIKWTYTSNYLLIRPHHANSPAVLYCTYALRFLPAHCISNWRMCFQNALATFRQFFWQTKIYFV